MKITGGVYFRNSGKTKGDFSKLGFNALCDVQYHLDNVAFYSKAEATPPSDKAIFTLPESELVLIGDLDLKYAPLLKEKLGINNTVQDIADGELILKAYQHWYKDCVKHLNGGFAFAIWDNKKQEIFCARDHMGINPFYYYFDNGIFLFSNKLYDLSLFSVTDELDEKWLTDFFIGVRPRNNTSTVYKKVKSLLPAHYLSVSKDNYSENRYWELNDISGLTFKNINEAAEGVRWHIENAVKEQIGNITDVGIELSGGIDSSGIAAMAQNFLKEKNKEVIALTNALPINIVFDDGFTDEWKPASQVAKYIGISEHYRISDAKSIFSLLEKATRILGFPANGIYPILQQNLYSIAQEKNVKLLFSGFGGNELVSEDGNSRYITELIKKNKIKKLYEHFRMVENNMVISGAKLFYHYWRYFSKTEYKELIKLIENNWSNQIFSSLILNNPTLKRTLLENLLYPYQTLRERSLARINAGVTTTRIEKTCHIANFYGLKYCYPLLDIPLMEYYFSIPDQWKASNKMGRSLFRMALKDLLPVNILKQPKVLLNTTPTPYSKILFEKEFHNIKDYCLSLPSHHLAFSFVDRNKILKLKYSKHDNNSFYRNLNCVMAVGIFMEQQKPNRQV